MKPRQFYWYIHHIEAHVYSCIGSPFVTARSLKTISKKACWTKLVHGPSLFTFMWSCSLMVCLFISVNTHLYNKVFVKVQEVLMCVLLNSVRIEHQPSTSKHCETETASTPEQRSNECQHITNPAPVQTGCCHLWFTAIGLHVLNVLLSLFVLCIIPGMPDAAYNINNMT